MSFAGLVLLLSSNAIADAVAPGRLLGRWSDTSNWETQERDLGDGRKVCVTSSALADGVLSSVFFTFGANNEVGFLTDRPITASSSLRIVDGGGSRDAGPFTVERAGSRYLLRYRESPLSMGGFLQALNKHGKLRFVLDGTPHDVPMADFAKAYDQMKECERHRLGMVLLD